MRLRTLPLAIVGIGYGLFAVSQVQEINWLIGGLTLSTAILLQIFSNIANDYGDYKNGADTHREDRATASGSISTQGMKILLWGFGILSFGLGVLLLLVAFKNNLTTLFVFVGLGILCLIGAYKYTAGNKPYGYEALGDVSVFLFFGVVGVLGTYYLQTNAFHSPPLYLAISSGLLAVSVLNINNMRDIETDKAAGKKTLATKLGLMKALLYQKTLYSISLGFLAFYAFKMGPHASWESEPKIIVILLFYFVFFLFHRKLLNSRERKVYNNLLKINVLLILALSILFWFI